MEASAPRTRYIFLNSDGLNINFIAFQVNFKPNSHLFVRLMLVVGMVLMVVVVLVQAERLLGYLREPRQEAASSSSP